MSFVNHRRREINCKIVYYGPGMAGKTTNLQYIHMKIHESDKGKFVHLATETARALFFDFYARTLPFRIWGYRLRFHLYTVPGAVFYDDSRKLILKGTDAIVFVADSQAERLEANLDLLENLHYNLAKQGDNLDQLPMVFQYNKRDLPNAMPFEELQTHINPRQHPAFEAVAVTGLGVFDTLKALVHVILPQLLQHYKQTHPAFLFLPDFSQLLPTDDVRPPETQPNASPQHAHLPPVLPAHPDMAAWFDQEGMARLRQILAHPPGEPFWLGLIALLELWPDIPSREQAVHYAITHTKSWPIPLCSMDLDRERDFFRQETNRPLFPLIRTLTFRETPRNRRLAQRIQQETAHQLQLIPQSQRSDS